MISIIIPVYQAEKYISATINSVRNQSYEYWELILVDDGSTDKSGQICDDFSAIDKRIRSIHKSNGGQSSARNVGIEEAKGDYIFMMDNDDILYPEACEYMMELMTDDIDIVACSYNVIDEYGKLTHNEHTGKISIYDNNQGMKELLLRNIDIYVWTKLYRKSFLYNNLVRFEDNRNDEDFLFNSLAYANAKKTVYIDIPIYQYLTREDSACRQLPKLKMQKYILDTCYRLDKIENLVISNYPDLMNLAKRQTIFYTFIMLGRIAENKSRYNEFPYKEIMFRLYRNRKQVISEHKFWGMSYMGAILAILLPSYLYYLYRKCLFKYFK